MMEFHRFLTRATQNRLVIRTPLWRIYSSLTPKAALVHISQFNKGFS